MNKRPSLVMEKAQYTLGRSLVERLEVFPTWLAVINSTEGNVRAIPDKKNILPHWPPFLPHHAPGVIDSLVFGVVDAGNEPSRPEAVRRFVFDDDRTMDRIDEADSTVFVAYGSVELVRCPRYNEIGALTFKRGFYPVA